jgi:hypothetical protein
MEENKLFNEIKSAVENAETKDFPGMEKVWNRVEEKLDTKEDKKAIWRWKKIAVAASLLLFATLGYQFLKNDQSNNKTNDIVTTEDSIRKTNPIKVEIATRKPLSPEIKKDAQQILQKQINPSTQVAMEYSLTTETDLDAKKEAATQPYKFTTAENGALKTKEGSFSMDAVSEESNLLRKDLNTNDKKNDSKEVELFLSKGSKVSNGKKEEPLILFEDKVVKKKLENIQFNAADSLVVLNEPLYIINGVEYTEQEVFGPNPTSPYTPLTKQDIETVSILQNEKAIEIYGEKGKKGIVIITTKTRKPVNTSKKTK